MENHILGPRPLVLIVEDEPILRMAALDMVEDAGFAAIAATDATDAIRILGERTDIRIVFTDVDMPRGMNGIRLAALIRDRWPPIHIIVTSGIGGLALDTMPLGSTFFAKPYEHKRVVAEMCRMAAMAT